MAKYHGKSSNLTVGGVQQAMREWRWESLVEVAESTDIRNVAFPASDGSIWDDFVSGFGHGTAEAQVMYDDAIALPAFGAAVTFTGTYGGGHSVSFSAIYVGGPQGANIKDSTKMTLRFQQTGNPTFA